MRRVVLFAALCAVLPAFGQTVSSDAAFGRFVGNVTGANKTTVGFASNGTTVIQPGVPTSAAPDGGSGFKVSSSGTLRNPAGNPVAVTATGRVTNAAAGKAIARFAFKAGGSLIGVLGVAIATKQLFQELGWTYRADPNGGLIVSDLSGGCSTRNGSGCYQYWAEHPGVQGFPGTWFPSVDAAANDALARYNAANYAYKSTQVDCYPYGRNPDSSKATSGSGTPFCGYFIMRRSDNGDAHWVESMVTSRTLATAPQTDFASEQAVADAIAAKSGWPTSSAIAQAAVEAKTNLQAYAPDKDPVKAAEDFAPLNVVNPIAAGPATSPGTTTTQTSNNADGSQRTEQVSCTYNHAYNGADVVTTQVCSTTVTNDGTSGKTTNATKTDNAPAPVANGSVTVQPTTVVPPVTPASSPAPTCGVAGQPACAVKVDETGTAAAPQLKLDETAIDAAAKDTRDKVGAKPTVFGQEWSDLFVTPPVVACVPLTMPQSVGSVKVDPCPVVDGTREVMAILWALGAFWICLGFVREAV